MNYPRTKDSWLVHADELEEIVEKPKPINTLKKKDPVMCSDDGHDWRVGLYYNGHYVLNSIDTDHDCVMTDKYKYIVPLEDFDFNNLESNIARKVIE